MSQQNSEALQVKMANYNQIVLLDFETYYNKNYSLTHMATSAYVRDPQFLVHMMAMKINNEPTIVLHTDKQIREALGHIEWTKAALLAHNTLFDGFILTQYYGHVPAYYLDTLAMARAHYPWLPRLGLGPLLEQLKLGSKNTEALENVKGVRELSSDQRQRMSVYAINDADGCRAIFDKIHPGFPPQELDLINLTTRMFCEPKLEVDVNRINKHMEQELVYRAKARLLADADESVLLSNNQFADKLRELGIEPERKMSTATSAYTTYAFAKNDQFMRNLLNHEDPKVKALANARILTKSTLSVSRSKRLLADRGLLPVGYKYWGAHTGRWSGANKMNLQNLPRKSELRKSIVAPRGKVMVVVDSGQIEARVTAQLAGEEALIEGFRRMKPGDQTDIYTDFASHVYVREITKADEVERFLGKTCILGLGFGMGAKKLLGTLENSNQKIDLDYAACHAIVHLYRTTYPAIPQLWNTMERVLDTMLNKKDFDKVPGLMGIGINAEGNFIKLPSGLYIRYPGLYKVEDQFWYREKMRDERLIWGGVVTENVVQALARQIIAEQMLEIDKRYRVVMMTHDEIVTLVNEDEADMALDYMLKVMTTPPSWAPELPLAAEGEYATYYCK